MCLVQLHVIPDVFFVYKSKTIFLFSKSHETYTYEPFFVVVVVVVVVIVVVVAVVVVFFF